MSTNMTHNSRKAWTMIRKLSDDPTTSNPSCLVSVNQVAHQLLVNGRSTMPSKPKRPVLPPATEGDYSTVYTFSEEAYRKVVAILIPALWRQSKIIAILKAGKHSVIPKSYRPISVLCHT